MVTSHTELIFALSRRLKARLEALPGAEQVPDKVERAATIGACIHLLIGALEAAKTHAEMQSAARAICHFGNQLEEVGATLPFAMPEVLCDILSEAYKALTDQGFKLPDHVRRKAVDDCYRRSGCRPPGRAWA